MGIPFSRSRMGDRDESISHAFLALGIVGILIFSICIAWCIVMCERSRRKRKYRPGQQSPVTTNPRGIGIVRNGPSPQINRSLLVPKGDKEHLVIANKAFLSKSTPHLLLEDVEVEPWDSPSVCGSAPPLFDDVQAAYLQSRIQISPAKGKRPSTSSRTAAYHHYVNVTKNTSQSERQPQPHHSRAGPGPKAMSMSQPALLTSELEDPELGISIHEQIAAILGTFPNLKYTSSKDTISETGVSISMNQDDGPESAVDDEVDASQSLISVTVVKESPPKTSSCSYDIDENITPITSGRIKRPTTLDFEFPPPLQIEYENNAKSPSEDDDTDTDYDVLLETTL